MTDQPRTRKPRGANGSAPAPEEMTIEAALAELDTIARRMEEPSVPLEETLRLYERGKALARHCQQVLSEAKLRVEVLRSVEERTATLEAFSMDEDE